eukprot:gnl/TRDRNA2_/TRDRNA2_80410_c0_seq2.p2 gnl/TRDRNA2_/TRDRNA2_80410_c0~~gnl/TRDRNA2_/TRDRNA2_80410_c0_seq2.p2  ORF type:complete len:108 (+),score=26.83 gnl/TRDRNA2_/TRDRNA2_80410_c0_seq2:37-360(+)
MWNENVISKKRRHPKFRELRAHVAVLAPGESLVVPGGWWRYSVALEPNVLIHHPFFNMENRGTLIKELQDSFNLEKMPPELRDLAQRNFEMIAESIMDDEEAEDDDL